ncbi:MAG: hypothetical protein Sylvanvirus10_8 [Sylvanvirus sp.]|uniref:Uncharacterized protein n=1 Tax=Sylvanvirus sp. TaxID=2487774 RepID=A0A3G5AJR8_9VIRU|nr:MAG: hypothetical protein Sylvanvirus10_8 [Sylvanvirus sp.]
MSISIPDKVKEIYERYLKEYCQCISKHRIQSSEEKLNGFVSGIQSQINCLHEYNQLNVISKHIFNDEIGTLMEILNSFRPKKIQVMKGLEEEALNIYDSFYQSIDQHVAEYSKIVDQILNEKEIQKVATSCRILSVIFPELNGCSTVCSYSLYKSIRMDITKTFNLKQGH